MAVPVHRATPSILTLRQAAGVLQQEGQSPKQSGDGRRERALSLTPGVFASQRARGQGPCERDTLLKEGGHLADFASELF